MRHLQVPKHVHHRSVPAHGAEELVPEPVHEHLVFFLRPICSKQKPTMNMAASGNDENGVEATTNTTLKSNNDKTTTKTDGDHGKGFLSQPKRP